MFALFFFFFSFFLCDHDKFDLILLHQFPYDLSIG